MLINMAGILKGQIVFLVEDNNCTIWMFHYGMHLAHYIRAKTADFALSY